MQAEIAGTAVRFSPRKKAKVPNDTKMEVLELQAVGCDPATRMAGGDGARGDGKVGTDGGNGASGAAADVSGGAGLRPICPGCGAFYNDSKVTDSRTTDYGRRRRRKCKRCGVKYNSGKAAEGFAMAKKTKVWSVRTGDENYSGQNSIWLLEGATAAVVEKKALKLAINSDVLPGEKPSKPYIGSIELVGYIDG